MEDYSACSGKNQSPIDLKKSIAKSNKSLGPINFHNYDISYAWNIIHNGHSSILNNLEIING